MRASVAAATLAVLLAAAPAFAKPPKASLDDRVDSQGAAGASPVGQGNHMGRKETQPGTYFSDRSREAVRAYYAAHPPKPAAPVRWEIGQRLPAGAAAKPVPAGLAGKLPKVPPGHRYVQVAGDILLVAVGSQMVVDGIAR